jgi:uncharacterized lipoprotein YmbA
MKIRWFRPFLVFILIILLGACSTPTPPTELAPSGDLIQQAIALQLEQTEQQLSRQLNASHPTLEIGQIRVKKLDPLFIADLPAYRLQGTYKLKITLPRQQVTQPENQFEIYLQRQSEGKTWRLLRREVDSSSQESKWSSYALPALDS